LDFDLSPDQLALRDAAADLLAVESSIDRVRAATDGFDRALWASMIEQGWTAIAVPEADGGLGLGVVEVAVLLEQAGAHLSPVPLLQQLIAIAEVTDAGQRAELLAGDRIAAVAHRSVERNGDGSVSGRPEPVIYGALADVLVVPTGNELVAVDLADVARSPEPAMDQTRELAWIDLDHAPATVIGDVADVAAHRRRGAVFHAAEMLGSAEAVMRLAVEYAKEREQFGRPIGSFQAVKHRCADILVDVEGMRSAVYHAAWAIGADDPDAAVAAATAKIWCSDAGVRVAESALQVHGGIGFTWEADVHLHLKRAQLDQVSFGDARHHRTELARMLTERLETGGSVLGRGTILEGPKGLPHVH
jgi:alkylation response protein AidB-like acyl-CoA dehydrogenase